MTSTEGRVSWVSSILRELGLVTLWNTSKDVKILCLQRFVRFVAYGASTLILVVYLEALNTSKKDIGLFMTLTLWGDVGISVCLTMYADAMGRKTVLVVGAGLMAISGVAFALSSSFWVLLLAAIFGVISPR
jgi:predicted MFS family arabinose efflux permease